MPSVTIRLARSTDADDIQAIYAPIVRDTPVSFEWEPPTAAEIRDRINKILNGGLPWLVCAEGSQCLGYAYATHHRARAAYRWSVEVSVYVHERARRRGIG